jgi:ribokinase
LTILVVGNATVDLSYAVERLPLPSETLLARSKVVDAGGKGLNQAILAHRAGASVRFCAPVGDDAAGQVILRYLAAEGLSASFLQRNAGATDESLIFVSPTGENAIVSTADAARSLQVQLVRDALTGLNGNDFLLMQGNLTHSTTLVGLQAARASGLRTVLNPAPIAFDYSGLWPLIDVAVLNEVEATLLGDSENIDGAAAHLLAAGSGCVVATLGSAGARLYDANGMVAVPAPPVLAVDTTGAGDVLCGVLAAGLAEGIATKVALGWAVAAACLSVTRRGTGAAFPSGAELAELRSTALSTAALS